MQDSVADFVQRAEFEPHAKIKLLDVGVGNGCARRYLERVPGLDRIHYHGVDTFPLGHQYVYKHHDWQLYDADLEAGLPFLDADRFDIVLCEQVLEHLKNPEQAAAEMVRVLKPGGLLIVGVPIFPPGMHLLRKHLVPVLDRWFKVKKKRGHCQAFALHTFKRLLREAGSPRTGWLDFRAVRGFRILSGGPLRPLENFRWWWKFNSLVGTLVPGLCIEAQVVATKSPSAVVPFVRTPRAAQRQRRAA